MNLKEIDTGGYLDGINVANLEEGYTVVPEIFILKVRGGHVYYRDVLLYNYGEIKKINSTAVFVPDSGLKNDER